MRESFKDKLARQIALEDESRALGASRYRARRPLPWRHEPSSTDEEGDLPPGRQLLRLAIQPTAEAIRSFCDVVNHGGGTRIPEAALILSSVGAEEAAYLTGRVILSAAAEGKKLTATAIAVADAIIEHQQMENLRRARADGSWRNTRRRIRPKARSSSPRRAPQSATCSDPSRKWSPP